MDLYDVNMSFARSTLISIILSAAFIILGLIFSGVLLGLMMESFSPALIADLPDPINTQRGIAFASSLCIMLGIGLIDTHAIRSRVVNANMEGEPIRGIISTKTLMTEAKWRLLAFAALSFTFMPSSQNSVLLLNLALLLVVVNRSYASYQVKQFIRELAKLGYISQERAVQLVQCSKETLMNITDLRDTKNHFLDINHRDNRITFFFAVNTLTLTAFSSFGDIEFTITIEDTKEVNALKDGLAHFLDDGDGRIAFNNDKETFISTTAPDIYISTTNWGEPFEEGVVVKFRTGQNNWDELSFSVGACEAETILRYLDALPLS